MVVLSIIASIISVGFTTIVNYEGDLISIIAIYPKLRSMSTIIYLVHMYVWTFYYMIVYGEKTHGADSFIVTSIVAVLVALGYIVINQFRNNMIKSKVD